ncbi:MAG: hypothetical protein ACOYVF_08650 [Candidatus Zixiibacteriota bacterium]
MKRNSSLISIGGAIMLFLCMAILSLPEPVGAIPAFARKYSMSCTTCHTPVPRLKAYGDDFAGNGFVLKDQEATRYFVNTGDQRLDLIRDLPIAVRMEGFVKHQTATGRETDFTAPYNVKFLTGGSLTKNVSYYFYFFFSERGEVAGIEDAYIMFNDLMGQDFDVYVGQFQISDPLYKRELRLTYEDYTIYKTTIAPSSTIALAYDRGFMVTYGLPTGTDIVFELVNGNGIGEADEFRTYDNDKYKNVVGRISQDVTENLRLGVFGLYGKEQLFAEPDTVLFPGAVVTTYDNEAWIAGPDMTATWQDKLELNLQYLERRDDLYSFAKSGTEEVETRGGLAELIVMPDGDRSRWYFTGLYNKIDSDLDEYDYETITAHVGYLLRTNLRLIFENTYDIENEENRAIAGFVAAF